MRQKTKKRTLKWLVILPLALLAVAMGIHFGPRYIYIFFGDMALSEVPTTVGADEKQRIRQAAGALKARVAWSSSRSGNHEIYMLSLPGLQMYRLTDNQYVDYYPRFSPDGKRLVFARSQKPWVSERDRLPWDAYILDLASGKESLAAKNANYPQWVGAGRISFMRGSQVVIKELGGGERVIFDASRPPVSGRPLTPELSPDHRLLAFTARGGMEATLVYNPATKALQRMAGGCEITWFPDSRSVLWVENGGHGGNRILASALHPVKPRVFMDLPGSHSHEYFPRLSTDGKWLVWGATASGHEHDIADYEIFLWRVGRPWQEVVRLTYNQANDRWPDIFIEK